jgi:hypothetical protein
MPDCDPGAMTTTAATHWRELARRTGNGVEIALLCNEVVNRIKVVVSDDRLCHHLDFELDGAEALSAFRRPFADATAQLLAGTDEFWGFNESLRQTDSEEGLNS